MRHFFLGMLCLGLGWAVQAQEGQNQLEKQGPAGTVQEIEVKLKVGDKPPALNASKWVKGKEVTAFEKGKVYVVEFWATWCGPCIVMMPHLSALQKEYADQSVTVIGFTAKDDDNTQAIVEEFVAKNGRNFHYTFAFADDRATYDNWMKAAGQGGIPCTFVVDKEGKIAYIGHPMFLDIVLPKVVAGKWDGKEDTKKLAVVLKDFNLAHEATRKPDVESGLNILKEFEAKYPELNKIPYLIRPKINMMLKAGKKDDAKSYCAQLIDGAVKYDDPALLIAVASTLVGPNAKNDRGLAKLALVAANKAVAILGDKDLHGQVTLARVAFSAGDKIIARKVADNAVEIATAQNKEAIKKALKPIFDDSSNR